MNRSYCCFLIPILSFMAVGLSARASVVYVNKNAPGPTHDGTSWATAFTTVQAGVNAAASGDEIWVASSAPAAPAYVESITLSSSVALYGGFEGTETQREHRDSKANPTEIDGTGLFAVLCQAQGVVVDGFLIRNGHAGVGVSGGSAIVSNNDIVSAMLSEAANVGIAVQNASATLSNNKVGGTSGGVTIQSSTATITGNFFHGEISIGTSTTTFSNNVVWGSPREGIYVQGGTTTLSANTISGNSSDGVSFLFSARVTIRNNTITSNGGSGVRIGAGTSNDTPSTATLTNNIVAFNSYGVSKSSISSIATFSHNDVYGNMVGSYSGYSPPSGQGNLSVDPKFSNEYHDIHIQPDSPCRDAGDDSVVQPGDADIDGQPRIQGASVDIGSDESDGTVWTVPSLTWYVSQSGDDANDGKTWATAKKTVAEGLAVAQGTDEVWVAKGTYTENVALRAGVSLYGGFAGTETQRDQRDWRANPTILDGTGGHVIDCSFQGIVVDGFSIRTYKGNVGVSVGPGTATISHNDISTNTGGRGVQVIGLGATATITNNVIWNNTVSNIGGEGVWVDSGGTATISNNTISGQNSFGVEVYEATARLANNIIAFNGDTSTGNGDGLHYVRATILSFSHNDLFGNGTNYSGYTPPSGQGNISQDPLFVDAANADYHLQASSPAIDAGDDSAVASGETDLDGKPRILGSHVDIGAYEYGVGPAVFTFADVSKALQIAGGTRSATSDDLARLNMETANAGLDVADAVRIARKAAGLE